MAVVRRRHRVDSMSNWMIVVDHDVVLVGMGTCVGRIAAQILAIHETVEVGVPVQALERRRHLARRVHVSVEVGVPVQAVEVRSNLAGIEEVTVKAGNLVGVVVVVVFPMIPGIPESMGYVAR